MNLRLLITLATVVILVVQNTMIAKVINDLKFITGLMKPAVTHLFPMKIKCNFH